jgi:hypothetical protein
MNWHYWKVGFDQVLINLSNAPFVLWAPAKMKRSNKGLSMASTKQIQHRLKQSRGRLQRLSEERLELESTLASLDGKSPAKAKVERQLSKKQESLDDVQATCLRLEGELTEAQNNPSPVPAKAKKTNSLANAFDSERLKQLEAEIEDMQHLEKQLELAQRSNLERFKQIQLQIRDLSKLTDRLLVVESELRDLKMQVKGQRVNDEPSTAQMFEDEKKLTQNIFQPQPATTSPTGEPLSGSLNSPWPWPEAMSLFLKGWLRGRKWWGHEDWLGLLNQLSTRDFSQFASKKYHFKIGAFLEEHRKK